MLFVIDLMAFLSALTDSNGNMLPTVINSIWFAYFATIVVCLFFSGFIIRYYGETCGINIYRPDTWMTTLALMGSPYCRILNQIGQISGNIMDSRHRHLNDPCRALDSVYPTNALVMAHGLTP